MRAYLPLRVDDLAGVRTGGTLPARPLFAVTEAMRAADPTADEEELEFDALCAALDAAAEVAGAGRRLVAAAEVPDSAPSGSPVDLDLVVSFHVEERPAGAGEGYDALLWYDVTEIDALADLA